VTKKSQAKHKENEKNLFFYPMTQKHDQLSPISIHTQTKDRQFFYCITSNSTNTCVHKENQKQKHLANLRKSALSVLLTESRKSAGTENSTDRNESLERKSNTSSPVCERKLRPTPVPTGEQKSVRTKKRDQENTGGPNQRTGERTDAK
jgi:hypothetical protein